MSSSSPTVTAKRRSPAPDSPRVSPPAVDCDIRAGDVIAPFVVLGEIARGGMGIVFAAYDRELDRKVAIKVLQRADHARSREDLLLEARAIAQLTHPNVVTVYQVGTLRGQVFFAMEYAENGTLSDWLRDRPDCGAQDVVDIFVAAGAGLLAAHRAGLVHRDFKPSNVLIGADGRPQVSDFGLASSDPRALGDASRQDAFDETGTIVGTPRYMAPEQLDGAVVDARSDQYSFCVALEESIHGRGRKPGKDTRPMPRALRTRLKAVLARGLAEAPEDRFPSMAELLAALEPNRTRSQLLLGAVAVTTAAVAIALFASRGSAEPPAACTGAHEELAGIWDHNVEARTLDTFRAIAPTRADDAHARVSARFDQFGERWAGAYTRACRATRVLGVQPESDLAMRHACLQRQLSSAGALTRTMTRVDASSAVVDRAVVASLQLPDVTACDDLEALRARKPAAEAADPEGERALRAELDELSARERLGFYSELLDDAVAAEARAADLGNPGLQARALFLVGLLQERQGQIKTAESSQRRAATLAALARDDDRLAGIWNELFWLLERQARYPEAELLGDVASAAIARAGEPGDRRGDLLNNLGVLRKNQGRYAEARQHYRKAIEFWQARSPDHPKLAATLDNLGVVEAEAGDLEASVELHQRALAMRTRVLGDNHPELASSLNNLGYTFVDLGQPSRAQPLVERAIALWEAAHGADHPQVASGLGALGFALTAAGKREEADQHFARAARILERSFGADHPRLASTLTWRADNLNALARHGEALAIAERVVEIVRAAFGEDHMRMGGALSHRGRARLGLGMTRDARRDLEKALEIFIRTGVKGASLGRTSFALARTLWPDQRMRARARTLASSAEAALAGPPHADARNEIKTWLSTHRL